MIEGICPHCNAKMVEYKFGFNKGLGIFLGKLFDSGKPEKTDNLGLTYAQRTNSQKLRYWDLAVPFITEETSRKRGWWRITQKGIDFVLGKTLIHKHVIMYRNEIIRFEGDLISFSDVTDGYLYRADYAEMASDQIVSVDKETGQMSLI